MRVGIDDGIGIEDGNAEGYGSADEVALALGLAPGEGESLGIGIALGVGATCGWALASRGVAFATNAESPIASPRLANKIGFFMRAVFHGCRTGKKA